MSKSDHSQDWIVPGARCWMKSYKTWRARTVLSAPEPRLGTTCALVSGPFSPALVSDSGKLLDRGWVACEGLRPRPEEAENNEIFSGEGEP
jgi:hypothetical protein